MSLVVSLNDVNVATNAVIAGKIPKAASQVLYVAGIGTVAENYTELTTAYATAKAMTPFGSALSTTNRVTIVIAPGKYNSGSTLAVNTQYIDFVSLTGRADVILSGISVTANDVYLKGISTGTAAFTVGTNLNLLTCDTCVGTGFNSFAGGLIASGIFVNCIGGEGAFGGSAGTATGTFKDCTGGIYAFGAAGEATGTFKDCTGDTPSFAGEGGVASGTFTNCVGNGHSFAGSDGGIASGLFTNCIGGNLAFGRGDGAVLTGKLYWCRLTTGTFQTVSASGQTRMCLDGTNTLNNQG